MAIRVLGVEFTLLSGSMGVTTGTRYGVVPRIQSNLSASKL